VSLRIVVYPWTITTKVTTTRLKPILAKLLPANAELVVVAAAAPEDVALVCSATLTPKAVSVMTVPEDVVVNVVVAVVVAVQAVQVVQGALADHVPDVQPVQESGGQALPSHHALQGPAVQAPEEPHGPQFPPNGP
jgi:hypothetical protein